MNSQEEFILETRDHLKAIEASLIDLESTLTSKPSGNYPKNQIEQLLRYFHTIKGDAGILGFAELRDIAHAVESILEFRRNSNTLDETTIELVMAAKDHLSIILEDLDHAHARSVNSLLIRLKSAIPSDGSGEVIEETKSGATDSTKIVDGAGGNTIEIDLRSIGDGPKGLLAEELTSEQFLRDQPKFALEFTPCNILKELPSGSIKLVANSESLSFSSSATLKSPVLPTLQTEPEKTSPRTIEARPNIEVKAEYPLQIETDLSNSAPISPRVEAIATGSAPQQTTKNLSSTATGRIAASIENEKLASLRIPVELIDRLMNLVGELTLVRNQSLLAFENVSGDANAIVQRLDSVTSELQDTVIRTRMQPVSNLFGKFPRMVRDLARQLGKQISIETVGNEVELDKTVIEQLSDPLMHLIRNSVDHGLEDPEERISRGKSAEGNILLTAKPSDGQVLIEIRDNGRGIDADAIKAKALRSGLKSENDLSRMSRHELISLILMPGFSTAKVVTDVSGRGVGMDVVKTNIERINGSLSIDSTPGIGTTVTLRVPLTLAIIPCLMVTLDGQRFAIAQRDISELVCLYPGCPATIESTLQGETYRLRERLLPIVRLREVLRRSKPFNEVTKSAILQDIAINKSNINSLDSKIEYILIVRSFGKRFGLLVDEVIGMEEVVIKPMHPSMKRIGIFSGATLLGDGQVAMILSVDGISEHADCQGIVAEQSPTDLESRNPHEVHRVLLFENGPVEQFAIPLVQIKRIEAISSTKIETIGEQEYVQIEGVFHRLIRLENAISASPPNESDTLHLILPKYSSDPVGIFATRIVDIQSLAIELQTAGSNQPGVLGTASLNSRISLFLDLHQLIRMTTPGSVKESSSGLLSNMDSVHGSVLPSDNRETTDHAYSSQSNHSKTVQSVLVIDDTPFFREIVKRYFTDRGYVVQTAIDGLDGLRQLRLSKFDLVLSDIEMPNMDGWKFGQEARKAGFSMPMVALSSLPKAEHHQRAFDCGYDEFEEKLDHDRLMATVDKVLAQRGGRLL